MSAAVPIAARTLRGQRVRTLAFALLFGLVAAANAAGYRSAYPTLAERLGFVRSFGDNGMFRLFYGVPRDLLTVGGYSAWRVGGFLSILAAVWGLTAAVSALRGEEDAGRTEIVLAEPLTRALAYAASVSAVLAGAAVLWLAAWAGLLAGGLPAGGSAYLALATVAPAIAFAGVGALASQLASTRRLALELSTAVLAVALVLRMVADTASGAGWLRWLTPLGWTEEMRAFSGTRPAVVALTLAACALLLVLAGSLNAGRDIGRGLLHGKDSRPARLRLLSSPLALALHEERVSVSLWLVGTGLYGVIVGLLSTSLNSTNIPASLQRELQRISGASITTPTGAVGFYFLFFLLIASLFGAGQVTAARREEADGRLETLFSGPVGRGRWLGGRLVLAAAGTCAVALCAGLTAWAGAAAENAGIPLARMLEAAANCVPIALLFAGLGFLAFALAPRASGSIVYALVAVAFVWELFGSLVSAPHWIVQLTPFQHVALVPAQTMRLPASSAMLAIGLAGALAAAALFSRRDLTGH